MTRRLLLSLSLLLLTACAATPHPLIVPLQNPAFAGDANRDLVPYQARERDASACAYWMLSNMTTLIQNAATTDDVNTIMLRCMAGKGWQ
jgi:hypothetical protein